MRIKLPAPLLINVSKLDMLAILTGPMYYYVFGDDDRTRVSDVAHYFFCVWPGPTRNPRE